MSFTPDPERTRRHDVPAIEVELTDGNLWGLALPGPRLYPIARLERDGFEVSTIRIDLVTKLGYPLEVRRLWEEIALACQDDDDGRIGDAFRRLISSLLRLAHDLGSTEADGLLDPSRVDLGRIARLLIPAASSAKVTSHSAVEGES